MIPQTRKLIAVIVHYGEQSPTMRTLHALLSDTHPPDIVVVVDNNSGGAISAHENPGVHVLRPRQNLGYFGGIMHALRWVTHTKEVSEKDIVMCMNNDVVVEQEAVSGVRRWWNRTNQTVMVGMDGGYVNLWTGRAHITQRKLRMKTWYALPYIHGAWFSVPLKPLMRAMADMPPYFLYWEDVHISVHMAAQGVPLRLLQEGLVKHKERVAQTRDQLYYQVRNGAFFLEHFTPHIWKGYWRIMNRIRWAVHSIRTSEHAISVKNAVQDAAKGILGPKQDTTKGVNEKDSTSVSNIAAIVVTYNNESTIEECVRSLQQKDVQNIIVVDNASQDKTPSVIQQAPVRVLRNSANVGFATAANRGAESAEAPYMLFINPDARLEECDLSRALAYMEKYPSTGVVGLRLVSEAGVPERDNFGEDVSLVSLITRHWKRPRPVSAPIRVGWVSGGAMLVRKSIFDLLGGFDESFFLYWEDVDLCRRARGAGKDVAFMPDEVVVHRRGASHDTHESKTRAYDISADRYFGKHYSAMICKLHTFLRKWYRLFTRRAR